MTRRGAGLPLLATAAVISAAVARRPDLLPTAGTGEGTLHLPLSYVFLTPLTRLYDEVTILSAQQLTWLIASLLVVGIVWLLLRASRKASPFQRVAGGLRDAALIAALLLGWFGIGAVVPRPMASLEAAASDVIVVDFHSHTDQSHDGRWRWDAESNRRWHAAAGFDAAYVSDHQTMSGWLPLAQRNALRGSRENVRAAALLGGAPERVVTLLPAVETVIPGAGAHVNLLGVTAGHRAWFTHRRDLDTTRFHAVSETAARPLTLLTLPYDPQERVLKATKVEAIEWSNASPRGKSFTNRYRPRIRHLADSLGVAVVAASNHHGWGSTAAAWTLLEIPGWDRLAPLALDSAIRATIRETPRRVAVVERYSLPAAQSFLGDMLTLPALLLHTLRQLQVPERVALIIWVWIWWLATRSRRRVRSLAAASPG